MFVTRLDIREVRNLQRVELQPVQGLNVFLGANGAGKTSVLEALHLMGYGRSFRGRVGEGLIRVGAAALEVFVEWSEEPGPRSRCAGLRHGGQSWEGRLDAEPVALLTQLCTALAVITFEPGSYALVQGGGEPRRRFMDWGLLHVEPDFIALWRRYTRALKQRNALLKARTDLRQLESWDYEISETGEIITRWREHYLEQLQPFVQGSISRISPEFEQSTLTFLPGWRRDQVSLADALQLSRERDLFTGVTQVGPHRADWKIRHQALPEGAALSRGQAKLTALGCLLAQAEHYAHQQRQWPVIALDDLAAELDQRHQQLVLEQLIGSNAQIFLTGTESYPVKNIAPETLATFHVEQGVVSEVGLARQAQR